MRKLSTLLFFMAAICLFYSTSYSQGTFSGAMFLEYYYVLGHHDEDIKGRHGFWFRRIYFTYDNTLTDKIKMRLRLEMTSPGDFTSNNKMTPVVKDAYLSYMLGAQELMFGIIKTPTWHHIVEKKWEYRAIEKTPVDLQKMGSSRDFGISLLGSLDREKRIQYMVMFGNGASNNSEIDRGKKIYGSLVFKPLETLTLEVYGDYESQKRDKSSFIYQGFGAYEGEWGRIGAIYARRNFKQKISDSIQRKYSYDIFSVFAVLKVAEDLELIARYDRNCGDGFKNNFEGHSISYIPFADNAVSNLIISGVSWRAANDLWIIPNIKYVFYDNPDTASKPSDDAYLNLTVYFKF